MSPSKPKPRTPARESESNQKRLTSERITADLERFEESGGHVEVLGTTWVLKKVDLPLPEALAATPPKPKDA